MHMTGATLEELVAPEVSVDDVINAVLDMIGDAETERTEFIAGLGARLTALRHDPSDLARLLAFRELDRATTAPCPPGAVPGTSGADPSDREDVARPARGSAAVATIDIAGRAA